MTNKRFYYNGVDFLHRPYKETYSRQTNFINLYSNDHGDEYFNFKGKRVYLEEFTETTSVYDFRIESEDGETIVLSLVERDTYNHPYFLEFSDNRCKVRLYQYERTETGVTV